MTRVLQIFSFLSIFASILVISLVPGQLYGSTLACDRFDNTTNCRETIGTLSPSPSSSTLPSSSTNTGSTGDSVTEDVVTPLRLPDISPTEEDLGGTAPNENPPTTASGDNDNGDPESSDNQRQDQDEGDDSDSVDSNNDGDDSTEGSSLIPFP